MTIRWDTRDRCELAVHPAQTIAALKAAFARQHPYFPPEQQRLIYRGRLLPDDMVVGGGATPALRRIAKRRTIIAVASRGPASDFDAPRAWERAARVTRFARHCGLVLFMQHLRRRGQRNTAAWCRRIAAFCPREIHVLDFGREAEQVPGTITHTIVLADGDSDDVARAINAAVTSVPGGGKLRWFTMAGQCRRGQGARRSQALISSRPISRAPPSLVAGCALSQASRCMRSRLVATAWGGRVVGTWKEPAEQ